MSANIAKTSAILTANSEGFTAAYKAAENAAKSFGHTAHEVAAGMAEFEIGKEIITRVAEFGTELIKGSFEAIDALSKQAEKTGISTEALSRLQYAAKLAGVDATGLGASIVKLEKNLAEAATGGGQEAQKALADLGLTAADLANMSPDKAIAEIADKLKDVENPSQKAAISMALLSKSGADLIPLLNGGAEGLAKMYEESDKLGNTINATDAKKVEEAADAVEKIGVFIRGIGNAIAVDLAPYVTALADDFIEWGTSGESVSQRVAAGVEWVAKGIGFAADVVNGLAGSFQVVRGVVGAVFAEILDELANVAAGVEWLYNKVMGGNATFAESIRQLADNVKATTADVFRKAGDDFSDAYNGKASQAVESFFEKAREHADEAAKAATSHAHAIAQIGDESEKNAKKIEEALEKLRDQLRQFGMTEAQKQVDGLKQLNAGDDQIKEAEALQTKIDALTREKKAREDAQKAAEEYYKNTMTPAEKYAAEVEKINELLIQGYLDADTAQRAADKAAREYAKATEPKEVKVDAPKLLQAGSQAAATFVSQIQRNQRANGDPQLQGLKKQDEAKAVLVEIRDAVKAGNAVGDDWEAV